MWGWERIYGPTGVFRNLVEYRDNDQLLHEKFVGAPTETMVEKKTTLEKMEKEVFIKIIMGAAPIDEFDKFVTDWNNMGGEKMTQEVNDWYSSLNQQFVRCRKGGLKQWQASSLFHSTNQLYIHKYYMYNMKINQQQEELI